MNWLSETAVLWLPKRGRPYPDQFAQRAAPGSSDFFYYALDAFASIFSRLNTESDREPWAYVLDEQRLLSPSQIADLNAVWQEEMKALLNENLEVADGDKGLPHSTVPHDQQIQQTAHTNQAP